MLTVSEEAKEMITEMLEQNGEAEGAAVRLVAGQGAFRLALDSPKPGDDKFEHNGRTVLVVSKAVSKALDQRNLTVEEKDSGEKTLAFT